MPDTNRTQRRSWLSKALWGAAALMAVINLLAIARRAPIMARLRYNADEQAAQILAANLLGEKDQAKGLILLSRRDETAIWLRYRLNYLAYPHPLEYLWDAPLPANADSFDLLGAYGNAIPDLAAHSPPPNREEHRGAGYAFQSANAVPPTLKQGVFDLSPPLTAFGWIGALSGLAAITGAGWLVLRRMRLKASPLTLLSLSHLTGSALFAGALQASGYFAGRLSLIAPLLVAACFLIPSQTAERRLLCPAPDAPTTKTPPISPAPLFALLIFGILATAQHGWLFGLDWDGFAIWQLKAKAFFHTNTLEALRESVRFDYAHLDYPLLAPLQTWTLATFAGGFQDGVAQLGNFVFYLDLLALFYAGARAFASRQTALLGTAILAGLPVLSHHAVSGFADVPLAAYFFCAALALLRRDFAPTLPCALFGLILSKNEGVLGAACVLLVLAISLWRNREAKALLGNAALWSCVAALPWKWIQIRWSLKNDLISAERAPLRLGELPSRLVLTLKSWILQSGRLGPWYPCWGLMALLALAGLGTALLRKRTLAGVVWAVAALQLAGYTLIYLITPHELQGHINTSMDRLLLHVAPLLLFGALLETLTPEAASPANPA